MKTSEAWLIHCTEALMIAVGDQEMIELIPEQSCYPVPGSPDYCSSVVSWHGKVVPVMDLSVLHDGSSGRQTDAYLCLLHYQAELGAPLQHIALRVTKAPQRIQVQDSQVCEWPEEHENSRLNPATPCCFSHGDETVLIIDIAKLCSAEFRELAPAA